MKKILIIASSLRKQGNSNVLADSVMEGALLVGHQVEKIYLADHTIKFCTGCLSCQNTGVCPLQDDMNDILNRMKTSDVIVFATPIYFYEMSGQMKTFLDRTNPLFNANYQFRDIYLIASAAEDEKTAMDGAIKGLHGWIECFPNTNLKGIVYGNGLTDANDVQMHASLIQEAFELGTKI